MSDNVETMMYAGEVPWHRLGERVETEVVAEVAIEKAGLNWPVETRPVFTDNGSKARDHRAVVRTTDNAVLGIVGLYYTPIQNKTAFSLMDAVVGEGKAVYHTAGSLDGGRKIWILVKLPGDLVVGAGDRTEKFLLLCNTHDGSSALRMLMTPVRVVCQNTLNLALANTDGIRISHFRSADDRIKAAASAMKSASDWYDSFGTVASRLALFRYKQDLLRELTEELFPSPETEEEEKLHPYTKRHRERVIELFETGKGHHAIAGTAWAALNAVAEYVDHERGSAALSDQKKVPELAAREKRVQSIWFGASANLKRQAYEVIERQIGSAR